MSIATQTYGLPLGRQIAHGGSFASIGARIWLRLLASIQARLEAAAAVRAERELLALAGGARRVGTGGKGVGGEQAGDGGQGAQGESVHVGTPEGVLSKQPPAKAVKNWI